MSGSVVSFHDLYQRYANDIYRFSLWLSGNTEEAKDITSETFVRLWTAKNDIRVETVKAYLLTIARNLFLQRKRKGTITVVLDSGIIDPSPDPDRVAQARVELERVLIALQRLSESDRAALILRAYEGLSYAEIARVLGVSVSAIKVKIHRARLRLGSIINNTGESQ